MRKTCCKRCGTRLINRLSSTMYCKKCARIKEKERHKEYGRDYQKRDYVKKRRREYRQKLREGKL